MKNKEIISIVVGATLLTGCPITYVKNGISNEERSKDADFCQNYALQMAIHDTQFSYNEYDYAIAKDEYLGKCLMNLGYKPTR